METRVPIEVRNQRVARVAGEPRHEDSAARGGLAWVAGADRLWAGCALLAALLLAVAAFMPLWQMTLLAPQYPGGLHLVAYGTHMEGDLREINALNHYVGIKPIEPDSLIELKLFPFAMGALVLGVAAAAFVARRRWQRALVALAVWAAPVGMLADLQWWLHRYGHDLDPAAALRLEPFTPKVIGTTTVINFHTEAMVAAGFWLLVAAGLLVTVGPWVVRFVRDAWANTGEPTTKAGAVALVLIAGGALALATEGTAEAAAPQTTIAEAIAAAAPGDTVVITAGTYVEQVVIDKPLVLVGEGRPVIDGGGLGDVVRITAEDVTLRGFDIRNSARAVSDEPAGIRVTASRSTLEGNRLEGVLYGIALEFSDGHTVRDNYITSMHDLAPERRGHALYVWYSEGNVLANNVIERAKDGIFLGFASHTVLDGNRVTHLRYGVHSMYAHHLVLTGNIFRDNVAGASLMYTQGLLVTDNEFSGNRSPASGYGLLLKDVDDLEMTRNRIHHNRLGMTMDGAPQTPGTRVVFSENLIAYNQVALELFTTVDATFTGNTFIGNLQQVETRGGSLREKNRWSVDGRGNYWDDYQGFDANGDGVGDVAYEYEGAYEDLVRRNEAVRAYAFTPARGALDLAARWFPVYRPEARVVDDAPLMRPTVALAQAGDGGVAPLAAGGSAALVTLAAGVFLVTRRTFGKRWQ